MATIDIYPIRCKECGKVLGRYENKYKRMIAEGKTIEQALDQLNLTRICCRTNMMNPAKVPVKSSNLGTNLESKFQNLTLADDTEAEVTNPLLEIKSSQNQIQLPDIPDVEIPMDVPSLGTNVESEAPAKVIREYRAW